jgi:hypothetical protein
LNNVDRIWPAASCLPCRRRHLEGNQQLSITFGLRWDMNTPSVEKYDRLSFLDLTGANPDAGGLPGRLAFAGSKYGDASGAHHPELNYYRRSRRASARLFFDFKPLSAADTAYFSVRFSPVEWRHRPGRIQYDSEPFQQSGRLTRP